MMQTIITWFREHLFPAAAEPEPAPQPNGVRVRPPAERPGGVKRPSPARDAVREPEPELRFDASLDARIEDGGPGKNVLMRSKYLREDTGTHEVLKIIDESIVDENDDGGMDPYNTGRFDRSRNWNARFRK